MGKIYIYGEEFYKGYNKKELLVIREDLNLIQLELDANDLNGALKTIEGSIFKDIPEFAYYRINLLIRLKRLNEAQEVASMKIYDNFRAILAFRKAFQQLNLNQINDISSSKPVVESTEVTIPDADYIEKFAQKTNTSKHVNLIKKGPDLKRQLFTKVYVNAITIDELLNADIDNFVKNVLIACYYEKNDRNKGITYIKNIKNNERNEVKRKTYSKLIERLANRKNKFIDMGFYCNILKFSVDSDYANELFEDIEKKQKEQAKKEKEKLQMLENERIKKEENSVVIKQKEVNEVILKPTIITSKDIISANSTTNNVKIKQKKERIVEHKEERKTTIKDAFPNETKLISAYLYCLMNVYQTPYYIKQFDGFDNLIMKSVDDIKALDLFENVVKYFSEYDDIKLDYDEKSFTRCRKN